MVYVSIKKTTTMTDEQTEKKTKSWRVIKCDDNAEFIGSILSRKNAESRQNSIEAYALLDFMLSSLTDIKKAVLRRSENGKPYIENEIISFNLSHTDGAVACIIDTDGESVGIDAEPIGRNREKIIERFFDEKARQEYAASSDKPLEFARIWTEKEAYAKFTGGGLSNYSTEYPATCKFTHWIHDDFFVTACTASESTVRFWQNDEDC